MAKTKPNQRKVAPSYYKHRKKKKRIPAHERWVAGVEHRVCVNVPAGFDLKIVKKGAKVGRKKKRR